MSEHTQTPHVTGVPFSYAGSLLAVLLFRFLVRVPGLSYKDDTRM